MRKIAVIGGGIAGLALANRLLELKKENAACEVTLFEAESRLGGTIETETRDSFVLEKGPDSFISDKPWALELSKRIGLENRIIGTNAEYRKSFIVQKGRLVAVPEGFYLISPTQLAPFISSPLFSPLGKIRMGLEPFIPKRKQAGDESIGAFVRRRFGREALERAGQPMLAGIYTGDPENLSLDATMPRFKQWEREHGSVLMGLLASSKRSKASTRAASGPRYSLFLSYQDGMQTLTDALAKRLDGCVVKTGTAVQEISRETPSGRWKLLTKDGAMEEFDGLCSTLPAWKSALLLKRPAPVVSGLLEKIPYESVATLNLAFRRADILHRLDGFGFVVPKTEGRSVIACTFCDRKFKNRAPEGHVLLRAFVGGAFGREEFEKDEADIVKNVLSDLRELLGISKAPVLAAFRRYPRAMVQYAVGHLDLVDRIDAELKKQPGLYLTGSAYRGVGIPDCIKHSETIAELIMKG